MIYILMGVSGSGKTTVGKRLAVRLDLPFYDADSFHTSANIRKMKAGEPLNDQDRFPWLQRLSAYIDQWRDAGGAVLACSALKESYREMLSGGNPEDVTFIYLKGSKELIKQRIESRDEHFFPDDLLDSQFEALEEPADGITVSVDQEPEAIVDEIMNNIE
ncbi:MAG: gluconokinase [Balneolaceae bacterium]|nr:gluconokinase [Balneolaceae bacterium]